MLLVTLLFAPPVTATDYFVSPSGSDGAAGSSEAAPYATVLKARNKAQPGDTVHIMNGTYQNSGFGGGRTTTTSSGFGPVLGLTRSGSATDGYITFRAADGHVPKIRFVRHLVFSV